MLEKIPGKAKNISDVERIRLLRAAAEVFRRKGFEPTTIRDIADACGMQPGTLHYRYPSKESILVDMMRYCIRRVSTEVTEAASKETDPLLGIRAGLRAHIGFMISERDMVHTLLFDWRSLSGSARDELIYQRDAYEQLWGEFVKKLAVSGVVRPGVNLGLLRFVGFGAGNWVATWFRPGGLGTVRQLPMAFGNASHLA